MSNKEKPKSVDESVEGALLDAELFVKYKAPQRAIERLHEAIAHHPPAPAPAPPPAEKRPVTFAGDLSAVSIFDAVQAIENSRLTGALSLDAPDRRGRVLFNEGRIVGAECRDASGEPAFRLLVELTSGAFDFQKSAEEFPATIQALSNTNLLLDTLRQLDEEKNEQQ